jgi:hypothetical protein
VERQPADALRQDACHGGEHKKILFLFAMIPFASPPTRKRIAVAKIVAECQASRFGR